METTDIFILARPDFTVNCLFCGRASVIMTDSFFQGIHILGKYNCPTCAKSFFHTFPMGHDLEFPISFDETGTIFKTDDRAAGWLARPLLNSFFKRERITVTVEKEVFRSKSDVIILNCIDNCFGHSFAKLWNLQLLKSKYPTKSILVLVPKRMRWLVPEYVDEVWSLDAPFGELDRFLVNLDREVKEHLLPRFTNVYASKASTHLGPEKVDLNAFLKAERFDLDKFCDQPSRVTFVLREDRFWHRYPLEFFAFKIFVKLKLSKKIFVWRQNFLVSRVASKIKKKLPNVEFHAVGLNRTGSLSPLIEDLRIDKPTFETERQWCDLYSKSHIVIGVHGSNMLIPTALAGGFIEILPRDKIRHIAEDTFMNYGSRYTLFLGRHVDHFVSPSLLSEHATSMIKDFEYVHRNGL